MLPRLLTTVSAYMAALLLVLSPPPTLGGNDLGARQCPLTLSSTLSEDQWQIGCSDGVQASSAGATFDSSQLKVVRVSSTMAAVTLTPENSKRPTEVVAPVALSKVGVLVSSSLTSFSLEGAAGASVEIDAKTFTKMTALRSLSVTSVNITVNGGPLELQPTLNEVCGTIQRAGLVDFKVKVVKGVSLNLTKLDLGFNRLRHLPLAIFASRRLVTANLVGNKLAALRLSRRKLRRFLRLVALKRVLVGAIADFQEPCADGERKTIQVANRSVVVCQVSKEDDDDLVVDGDDDDDTAEDTTATTVPKTNSSSASSTSEEVGQTLSSTDAALVSRTARTPPSESPSPTPTSAMSPLVALSWTTACLLVATAALAL